MNIDALEANPLVAIEAKTHDLEGKDVIASIAVGTLDRVASEVISSEEANTFRLKWQLMIWPHLPAAPRCFE